MIGKLHEYEIMAECERSLWWYRCLHDLTLSRIHQYAGVKDAAILDAGCGTGGMLEVLQQDGYNSLLGFDLSGDALDFCRRKTNIPVQQLSILHASEAFPQNHFDCIISNDVICHLAVGDDRRALAQLMQLLKPGGVLIMNLPALDAFYGNHDIAVGLTKRYDRKKLSVLTQGIAEIKELIYWPFLLAPVIWAVRTLQRVSMKRGIEQEIASDVKMPSPLLNNIFYKLTSLENKLLKTKPFGSSAFLVMNRDPFSK